MNDNSPHRNNRENNDHKAKPSLLWVIGSVLAAAFGVQSNKNRERAFSGGGFWRFVAVGVMFTALFVLLVVLIVKVVLSNAGVA